MRDKTLKFREQDLKASELYALLKIMSIEMKDIYELLSNEGYDPLSDPFDGK